MSNQLTNSTTTQAPTPGQILTVLLNPNLCRHAALAIDEHRIDNMDIHGAVRYDDKVGYLMAVEDVCGHSTEELRLAVRVMLHQRATLKEVVQ